MPLNPGRKALSLYSLVRAKVHIQKVTQRRHCRDAWCLESQHPALRCWAPTPRHRAGGGYRESHPPCVLLRLTLRREPLRLAKRETWGQAQILTVLNGPRAILQVIGRRLPLFKPKSQSLEKQPELQHRAEVSSCVCKNAPRTAVWSTFAVMWEVADYYAPWSFKIGRNGVCPSPFL